MNIFDKLMKIKLNRLTNADSYRWLLSTVKPFKWEVFFLTAINLVSSVISVATAVITKSMVDISIQASYSKALLFVILFILAHILNVGLGTIINLRSVCLKEKMSNRVQKDMIVRFYNANWSTLNRYHSGDVLTRITSDVGNVVGLWTGVFPSIVALLLQLALAFATLYYFDAALALFAFVLGPVSVIISWLIGQRLKKIQHLIQAAESKCRSYIAESIQNILIIKTFEYENESLARIGENQKEKYYWSIKKSNISNFANFVLTLGYMIGYACAFLFGVAKISQKGITFGTFTAFLQLVGQVQAPFDGLSRAFPQMIASFASVERIMELEFLEPEKEKTRSEEVTKAFAGLKVNAISFSYIPERMILSDVSFVIKSGEIAALIGVSGEGKTTLMRLLLGILKPQGGTMEIENGLNHTTIDASTRGYFTYVPQGNTLFSGSISENLKVGNPDAGDMELEAALKAACAWDFVQSLPQKMDSIIGESGVGLSEGQSQRICIARALLRPSPILLLDEATSALDVETESKVLGNIRKLSPRKTCIAITHRLSVISSCDKVYRLENGRLYKHNIHDFSNLFRECV